MNKKNLYLSFVICSLVIAAIAAGCGQQTSEIPSSTTTTTLPGSTAVIIGVLKLGTISSGISVSSVKASSPIASYNVVAVSKETGKVYFPSGETDASGGFTIPNLPAGESFYLDVLDSENKLAAPVTFGTVEGKAAMAIDTGSSAIVSLGDIALDSSKKTAATVISPTALLDSAATVDAKSGETYVPKGAGNVGKGDEALFSGTYDPDKVDGDKDGLPNFFDADNNGDGIVDELDGLYTREALVPGGIPNFFTYIFSNLKIDFDRRDTFNVGTNAYSDMTLAVGVTSNAGKGAPSGKTISSVKVIEGPAWISKATIINAGGLWSATNFNVPSKGSGVFEVQLNSLKPISDVNAGDAMKFKVVYTDGTSEESIKMLNFIFTDIPRVTAYRIGSGPWVESASFPSSGPLGVASTSEVTLRWLRPKDETGKVIKGGRYTWEYNVSGGGAHEIEIIGKDISTAPSLEGGYIMGSLSDAVFSGSEFMVGVCIRSLVNDNAAENVRFTKGW